MNPLPVTGIVSVDARARERSDTGESFAEFRSTAGAVPVQFWVSAGAGSTQKMSPHVITSFRRSAVAAAVTPANDDVSRIPHDALMVGLNGTGIWCTSSNTE